MGSSLVKANRRILYAAIGFAMGASAPLIWVIIRLIFFHNPEQSLWTQVISDITMDAAHLALYFYMGFGTAVAMSSLGYFIGKSTDELAMRTVDLDTLHHEAFAQKEIFENRSK